MRGKEKKRKEGEKKTCGKRNKVRKKIEDGRRKNMEEDCVEWEGKKERG